MANAIAITGMGAISSAGIGVDALWDKAKNGVPCIHELDREVFPKARITRAAIVDNDPFAGFPDLKSRYDRFSAFALVAGGEAIRQAGLEGKELGQKTAVIIGSGLGGALSINRLTDAFYKGETRVDPMSVPKVMASAAASLIGMQFGVLGPTFCISSACASATQSIGLGAQLIRAGIVERAIVGGAEAQITPAVLRGWEVLRVLTPDVMRPFSKGRSGMALGEGSGILVLENAEAARKRGAKPLAQLIGYGTTSDAGDLLKPNPAQAARAMEAAIEDGGIDRRAIGYVNAHGTGTVLNDIAETNALASVFGDRLSDIPVSSTKPVHGHTIGAAGALELIVAIRALREQFVPPTINFTEPDERCDLDCVPNRGRGHGFEMILSNSFAFGGINACLIAGIG